MNIFHKIALQGLKKNRTRTFVTMAGVVLSTVMITAVATFAVSLQAYMVNGAIAAYGGWHIAFWDADRALLQEQEADSRTEHVAVFENIGYAMLEGGQNPDKPYLFLAGFNEETFDTLPVTLLWGRLPQNSSEILIPAHVASNGGVKLSAGDTLTLSAGVRMADGEVLNQHDPYRPGEEVFLPSMEKTYTIVGIYARPAFEERTAPGYTAITMTETAEADSFSAFVTLDDPVKVGSYTGSMAGNYEYSLNNDVLRFLGISGDQTFNMMLYSIGVVLIALVMLGSVFLIYNSFSISLSERTRQFGILMSIGATEKQLRGSVLFEGFCIGMIGIPIGILVGIPSIDLVLSLAAENFSNILYHNVPLVLKVSVPILLAAAVISMITILISAYIPAKKAAGTPVMECIRQTNEIRAQNHKLKTSAFTERIFGLAGTLALKNFKRNRRRYRSIILSLTLSVVLFVSASSFVEHLKQVSGQTEVVTDYDIGCSIEDMDDNEMLTLYDRLKEAEGVTQSSLQAVMEYACIVQAQALSAAWWDTVEALAGEGEAQTGELPVVETQPEGDSSDKTVGWMKGDPSSETVELTAEIQFLDDSTWLRILNGLGLPAAEYSGENTRLLAVAKMEDRDGRAESVSQLSDMFLDEEVDVTVVPRENPRENGQLHPEQSRAVSITCVEIVPPDTPPYTGIYEEKPYYLLLLAPWSLKEKLAGTAYADVRVKGFTFQSGNPSQSTSQMKTIMDGAGVTSGYTLYNVHAMLEENRNIIFIVNLFAFVFILMITLIAVANVFNTISTNIKLRRRELAMLRSVGMSDRDFNKMMRFECVLYGVRTMLLGLPVSGILSWLIYRGMAFSDEAIAFRLPWKSMGISMLGVFLVIFITMLYATHRIRKENIIEALRDELT